MKGVAVSPEMKSPKSKSEYALRKKVSPSNKSSANIHQYRLRVLRKLWVKYLIPLESGPLEAGKPEKQATSLLESSVAAIVSMGWIGNSTPLTHSLG